MGTVLSSCLLAPRVSGRPASRRRGASPGGRRLQRAHPCARMSPTPSREATRVSLSACITACMLRAWWTCVPRCTRSLAAPRAPCSGPRCSIHSVRARTGRRKREAPSHEGRDKLRWPSPGSSTTPHQRGPARRTRVRLHGQRVLLASHPVWPPRGRRVHSRISPQQLRTVLQRFHSERLAAAPSVVMCQSYSGPHSARRLFQEARAHRAPRRRGPCNTRGLLARRASLPRLCRRGRWGGPEWPGSARAWMPS